MVEFWCSFNCCEGSAGWENDLWPSSNMLWVLSPEWIRTWRARWEVSVNVFWHKLHVKGLCPECIFMCLVRFWARENVLLQILQENVLLPEWTKWCRERWDKWTNVFSQSVHLKGFSPKCDFMCVFKFDVLRKVLSQISHSTGLSPSSFSPLLLISISPWWTRIVCFSSSDGDTKDFPHSLHGWFFPKCVWACFWKLAKIVKVLSQLSHRYIFVLEWVLTWRHKSAEQENPFSQMLQT